MTNYLVKILITILFSALIAFFYYTINPANVINFDGYVGYIIPLLITYFIYKYFSTLGGKKDVNFSLYGILGYFLLNLFILCLFFFGISGGTDYGISTGVYLFFKIILLSIVPILFIVLSISFGRKLSKIFKIYSDEKNDNIFTFLISLGLGFFSFLFLLTVIGLIGFYNIYSVLFICSFFLIFSYKELIEIFEGFLNYRINFENHDLNDNSLIKNIAFKLLSTEFLFILASIILSVNLINIVRPMPIGWDDLGVYMNFPRQMAYSGMIDFLGGMYSWQIFTGIGFMIYEPAQAFFLNSVGGFLSFIVIILIMSDLLKDPEGKIKTIINIPLLMATIFISMPMVVFQQAKDMKLDEGLFFISIIVFYLVVKILIPLSNSLLKEKEQEKNNLSIPLLQERLGEDYKKVTLKILFVIGILAGFAFSIKFTSLLLISAIIGILFYTEIGFLGFLGYLGIYLAIFTKAGLWAYLNVIYPKDNLELINNFSYISFVIGIILLFFGFLKHKNDVIKLFKYIGIFILGILLAISPWIGKNIYQAKTSDTNISIGVLLSGKTDDFKFDLTKIYSREELNKIDEKFDKELVIQSGTSNNEDLGRYMGYEKGINNYVKLPWNLTMQLNQGGEFTTLGWLFLALIPVLFLFLKYRVRGSEYLLLLFLLSEILLFILSPSSLFLTNILSQIDLPFGYLILFIIAIIPVIFLLFSLKNNRINNLFKINLVFAFFYIFLFVISAFGIVWYGIVLYFSLLFFMAISLYSLSNYEENTQENIKDYKLFGSFMVFVIFIMYFSLTIIPYTFNNLKDAGYPHFKAGKLSSTEALFAYHPEYKDILLSLNINKIKQDELVKSNFNLESKLDKNGNKLFTNDLFLYNLVETNNLDLNGTLNFLSTLDGDSLDKELIKYLSDGKTLLELKKRAKEIRIELLSEILKPKTEFKNNAAIYRIGTFLKYYIDGNNNRLLEDSLVETFDKYIYSEDGVDKTVSNMNKLGLKYFLVDLNAATIDNDPRHDLTRRYENLLKTFTSNKLSLVNSDSICLELALENYKESKKTDNDLKKYIQIAGVNHSSYLEGKEIPRSEKLLSCYKEISNLLKQDKVNNNNYSYLLPIYNEYKQLVLDKQIVTDENLIKYLSIRVTHGFKVLFEIK